MAKRATRTELVDEIWRRLEDVGAARPVNGDWWPRAHARDGLSYGEWVAETVGELLETRLTRDQLELLADLVYRVGVSVLKT